MTRALSPHLTSIALLRALFPNANVPEETVIAYLAALDDLPQQDVEEACKVLGRRSRFLPTVAEIREYVAERRMGLPTPTEAWIEASARSTSTWQGERTPLVTRAIEAMGGTYLIKTSENPTIMRSQFLKAYTEMRDQELRAFAETGMRAIEKRENDDFGSTREIAA